jgi:solute carrier family 25 carnitine/acylcarnitine transporter 20/29
MAVPAVSSWHIARNIIASDGIRGLYFGGGVTALRDSIGYGFYFWSYELANNLWSTHLGGHGTSLREEAPKILICGGIAGVVTWASVFPLDVIKTRVQTQAWDPRTEASALLGSPGQPDGPSNRAGALELARRTYHEGGIKPFFRGLTICSIRAFMVNAVQWAVYEAIMESLGQGRRQRVLGDSEVS